MKIGINYDTGIFPGRRQSRPALNPQQVAFDMRVIARELHCTAVRVTGGDLERLTLAATFALDEGLDVWFSPFPCELDEDAMLAFTKDSADSAEALRQRSADNVVLVTGCEVSVFGRGFLPGADAYERMRQLLDPAPELFAEYPKTVTRLNAFLSNAASVARTRFAGPVTYASGPWEQIDWTPFDIVSVDAYRDKTNEGTYDQQLASLPVHNKPVAITEFGCGTYRGAGDRGASGWMILEDKGHGEQLDRDYIRDEEEQVRYFRRLVEIYERHAVDIAFWFTFASWNRPHRQGVRNDLDIASFGVVKVLDGQTSTPQNCWQPKSVFAEFAGIAPLGLRRHRHQGK